MKICKFFGLFVAVCAVVLSFSCGKSEGDATKKPVLVMSTNAEFPPYKYVDEKGEFAGIDVEIMQNVCEQLGYELKIENIQFDSIIPSLISGKADIGVAGMTVTEDRRQNVDFTQTYVTTKQVVIVRAGSSIKSVADLKNKKIGVQSGTTGDIEATAIEGTKMERFQKGVEAVLALTQSKLDAVVIDEFPAQTFVKKIGEGKLVILDEAVVVEEYAMAVNKGNSVLLAKVNAAISDLKAANKIQEITDKYNAMFLGEE